MHVFFALEDCSTQRCAHRCPGISDDMRGEFLRHDNPLVTPQLVCDTHRGPLASASGPACLQINLNKVGNTGDVTTTPHVIALARCT